MRFVFQLGVLLSVLATASPLPAQTLRVAAAAGLQNAMQELASQFEKQSGTKVMVSYGSSGSLRSQIANGAPFDVFLSADAEYPRQLASAGLADADTLMVYAHGHLVLWAPLSENLGVAQRGFDALKDERVKKIAIANPELAPYGKAALAALQKAGLYEAVKAKLVFGENISQTAQFVQSDAAQIGILALSLTFAESMKNGDRWELTTNLHPVIEQAAVVVHSSTNKRAARAFLDFVKGREGQQILMKYGLAAGDSATK
jgi:molybdate transport system substrate-binding protein